MSQTKRTVSAEDFFAAGLNRTTVLEPDEIVREIAIPSIPSREHRQDYLKFRIRNSIDFPIVGLAFLLNTRNNIIKDARIALNAVAPIPRRLKAVEAFLKGRPINEATAQTAGELAVKDAAPLQKNRYKLQVVKALLKKAILAE